jgi:hypothetical protein
MPPDEFKQLNYTDMKAYNVAGLKMQVGGRMIATVVRQSCSTRPEL